jgi:micrococcal nuclease
VGVVFALYAIGSQGRAGDQGPVGAGASTSPTNHATATVEPTPRPTASPVPTPLPTPQLGRQPVGQTVTGIVVDVVDGDTIKVEVDGEVFTVRYIGIDTPETVHPTQPIEWMGPEASAANSALVDGQTVVLEKDVSETDQYGRLLRYVWLEKTGGFWLLVNYELVRLGYANSSSYPPDVLYQDLFRQAEREASEAGVGLWGPTPTPVPTPAPTPVPTVKPPAPPPSTPAPSNCHPSYSNVCLQMGIGDYDCQGGSGNGPNYVKGPVLVVGPDDFGLDSDGDGVGCEG